MKKTMEKIVFHGQNMFTSLLHERHSNVKVLHRLWKWEEKDPNLWSNFGHGMLPHFISSPKSIIL